MKNRYVVTLMLGALLALGGCASSLSGDVYSRDDARAPQTVRMGTVESVRLVQIEGTKTVIGPAAGAAIGGVAGNSVGGGRGSAIAAIVGAVAGGMAGAAGGATGCAATETMHSRLTDSKSVRHSSCTR